MSARSAWPSDAAAPTRRPPRPSGRCCWCTDWRPTPGCGTASPPVSAPPATPWRRSTSAATDTCADDLAELITVLGWTGGLAPVVAGQSWGGNVVLSLAARHPGVAAIALVDGGWLRLAGRFQSFEECWQVLAPPSFEGVQYADLAARIAGSHTDWPAEGISGTLANLVELADGGTRARLSREHHRSIVHSLWLGDPRLHYPQVAVPALLMPAGASVGSAAVDEAARLLPDSQVSAYVGADHDLHAQHPARCALDLHDLAVRADARSPLPKEPAT